MLSNDERLQGLVNIAKNRGMLSQALAKQALAKGKNNTEVVETLFDLVTKTVEPQDAEIFLSRMLR